MLGLGLNCFDRSFVGSFSVLRGCPSRWYHLGTSFPEPANFLRRMLDENECSRKGQFLGDPDWLSEMQYNTISPLFADYKNRSFPEPFLFVEHAP